MKKGTKHSEETKKRISESKTGLLFSETHCQHISTSLAGKPKSKEHKKAIGEAVKAAKLSKLDVVQEVQVVENSVPQEI